jgi:RimJ/RimL family protein N-acetyltransferase
MRAAERNENEADAKPPPGRYLFYLGDGRERLASSPLPPGYTSLIWLASDGRIWPQGKCGILTRLKFLFRFSLFQLRLLADRECGAICVFADRRLVHYSAFTPRYWRFPFLKDGDIQIGNTWTHPAHRARGLASFALGQILGLKQRPGRRFWYVVGVHNSPSIRVIEKAGFAIAGRGRFIKPWGIKLFGAYRMESAERPAPVIGASTAPGSTEWI